MQIRFHNSIKLRMVVKLFNARLLLKFHIFTRFTTRNQWQSNRFRFPAAFEYSNWILFNCSNGWTTRVTTSSVSRWIVFGDHPNVNRFTTQIHFRNWALEGEEVFETRLIFWSFRSSCKNFPVLIELRDFIYTHRLCCRLWWAAWPSSSSTYRLSINKNRMSLR